MRQDNLPTTASREPHGKTADADGLLAKNPVDQTNYYGSTSAYDYDTSRRTASPCVSSTT